MDGPRAAALAHLYGRATTFRDAVNERFPGTWVDEVVEIKRPNVDVGAVLTAAEKARADPER